MLSGCLLVGALWCGTIASALEIEAESGLPAAGRAKVAARDGASGGKAVTLSGPVGTQQRPNPADPADLAIPFEIDRDGAYELILRIYAPDGGSDSVYWTVDDRPVGDRHAAAGPDAAELSLGVLKLEKGRHQLKFWTREPRFTIDKVTIKNAPPPPASPVVLQAEAAALNTARAEVAGQDGFAGGKGVRLKSGVKAVSGSAAAEADLTFDVQLEPGRYLIRTIAATDETGSALMAKAKGKAESLRIEVGVDDRIKHELCVVSPWQNQKSAGQTLGKFEFNGKKQQLKFWLPEHTLLDQITISPYRPPAVPPAAANYRPKLTPTAERPRLLVPARLLPQIRKNLGVGENRAVWEALQKDAARPVKVKLEPNGTAHYDNALEVAIRHKAFVCLMTGDKKAGREALALADEYLACVEFGNMLDITREIGRAIYSAALAYDWCYDLMTPEIKTRLRLNMMRLAEDMEIGWPPFLQTIVNGHGNEHQVSRDLFSMAVAIYDEDPIPYRLCAYRLLEELAPMHAYEYGSGRHNQGMSYGMSRFVCDMIAVNNVKRTLDFDLFGETVKKVPYSWIYMRLPNGEMMRDGDDFVAYQQIGRYWGNVELMFWCYTYAADPILKAEFERQGGEGFKRNQGMLFLLFNDPELKPQPDRGGLPLTCYMPEPYPAMVARTGWDFGNEALDAIVYLTGGGLNSANHQHLNAGDFQIYYRGLLAADLGTYKFYGTPYDMNFNKKSVAHNVLLVRDPADPNDDGSQVYHASSPDRMDKLESTRNGRILAHDFGPAKDLPLYSYLKSELAPAYPKGKLTTYTRSVVVFNHGRPDRPLTVVVYDRAVAATAKFKKYFQLNSLTTPETLSPSRFAVASPDGTSRLTADTLLPAAAELERTILTGKDATNVFGKQYTPPMDFMAETNGSRTMISPKTPRAEDRLLHVLQVTAAATAAATPVFEELPGGAGLLRLPGSILLFSLNGEPLALPLTFTVKEPDTRVLVADLAPETTGAVRLNRQALGGLPPVAPEAGTLFFVAPKAGSCEIIKEAVATKLPRYDELKAPRIKPRQLDFTAPGQ
jgi:heparin/heparan-sulfate lyase